MALNFRNALLAFLFTGGIALPASAQTKIGDTPTVLTPSAELEVNSTTRGFLPPRMLQAQMNAIVSPATGLIVYCLNCTPAGLRVFDGTVWSTICANNNPVATFAPNTLSCSGTLAGTYVQGAATTGSNTKGLTITSSTGGNYTASTNTVNGVTFAATGTIFTTGAGTAITLVANGTPAATGNFTYIAALGGQTCTFSVTYTAAAFACGNATQTQVPAGILVNGASYNGTYTLPYTAGNGSTYGTTTLTQNGLTLTRTAGTLASGGGNVGYTLSGTYTGTTNTPITFNVAEGCAVTYGDAIREALATAGCASCTAYDAAAVNSWVAITSAEYAALTNTSTLPGISKQLQSDAFMSGTPINSWNAGYTIGGLSGGTVPANSYVVALSAKTNTQTSTVTGAKLKVGAAAIGGTYADYGSVLPPTAPTGAVTQRYFAIKRPTASTPSSASYAGVYSGSASGIFGNQASGTEYFALGDVNTGISGSFNTTMFIQLLMTATKSW